MVLAQKIPWDKLANVYYKKMRPDLGAPTLSARMVIGAVIIKHMLNIDDREVVEQITENVYLQYFVGLSSFQREAPFDASLTVSIRKRLGTEVMTGLNEIILEEAGLVKGKRERTAGNESYDEPEGRGRQKENNSLKEGAGSVEASPSIHLEQ